MSTGDGILERARLATAEAQALRREHVRLTRQLAGIREDFERATGEMPKVDLTLLYQLIGERRQHLNAVLRGAATGRHSAVG
jgi:hypothetical protein